MPGDVTGAVLGLDGGGHEVADSFSQPQVSCHRCDKLLHGRLILSLHDSLQSGEVLLAAGELVVGHAPR